MSGAKSPTFSLRHSGDQQQVDRWLLIATGILLGLSILMVFSTTAVVSQELYGSSTAMIKKHLAHMLAGLLALVFFMRFDPKEWKSLAPAAFLFVLLLLTMVLVPKFGHVAGGARRWLVLGPLRFQPGELAKLVAILYFASYIGRHHQRMMRFGSGIFVPCAMLGVLAVLYLLEPDFGSTVVVLAVVFCQLLTASRLSHLIGVALVGMGAMAVLLVTSPYRMRRLMTFLDPFADANASGYQLIQSLIAVGSGGMSGAGLGGGKQKLFYLPAAHTDFIFAVIAEELGFIGASFVVLLFLVIAYRGLALARRLAGDPYLCSLVVGCTLMISLPALLNIAVVIGLLPTKGMVLPLVAYGGTAMVVYLAIMGLLLRLSRIQV